VAVDGDASIQTTNPNTASQWIVAVANTQTDWALEGSPNGNLNGFLTVNAGPVGPAVEVPPGTNNVVLPDVFHAAANLDLATYGGRTFIKPLRVTLASTPSGMRRRSRFVCLSRVSQDLTSPTADL
jgi:hypothetical protein